MTPPTITPSQVRTALSLREEIALLDLRHEAPMHRSTAVALDAPAEKDDP